MIGTYIHSICAILCFEKKREEKGLRIGFNARI